MRAQQLPSGNFRISISDGFDENGKRVYKSFTADKEWKVIKLAEDYKQLNEYYQQKIQQMLETLRQEPPKEIGGYKILSARDYKKDTIVDIIDVDGVKLIVKKAGEKV